MNFKFLKIIAFFAIVFTTVSCNKTHEKISLEIIQTTDVHGCIFPYDFIKNESSKNSLAQVYEYVKERRTVNPEGVILLDNGDYLQGQPAVYYYNFEDTSSAHLAASVFNYMNYNATTVGNHDIETGHAVYDRYASQLNAPYLAGNALIKGHTETYFKPYTILNNKGIKVAILGLITPGIPQWLPPNLYEGMEFQDMIESANHWIKEIEEKHTPDLIIGMFHAGIDHTYGNETGSIYMNENATKLVAEQVPGFDIVLAGHDHRHYHEIVTSINGDSVLLLDPKSHARAVAHIKVDFVYDNETESYHKSNVVADIVSMEDIKPADDFMNEFQSEYQNISNYVSRSIGTLEHSLSTKESYFGSSRFMNLIHEVQLENSSAHVSFAAPLSFNAKIESGDILVSDLFKLYKYENMLYTLKLSGEEIDQYLEFSYDLWFNTMKSKNDTMLKLSKRPNGEIRLTNSYYNLSSAYGIEYLVNLKKGAGEKVKILGFSNGNTFHADSTYLVALNSYRGNGGGGHLTHGSGIKQEELSERLVASSDKDLRYYLMKWIEEKQVVEPSVRANWKIIPEDYYEKAKAREVKLLFP